MLKIAICDDDGLFLETFAPKVAHSFANLGQPVEVSTFSDGAALIEKMEKKKEIFDIVFLDVDMPTINGFQVAQRLRELPFGFFLLFTTYLESQSREGYLYGAFRYVFKNNLDTEIQEAAAAIVKKLGQYSADQEQVHFKCRNLGVLENLTVRKSDIIYLKSGYARRIDLYTVHASYSLLVKPLVEYIEILHSSAFVPIMRSFIVNFNHVDHIEGDYFILTGGVKIPLGIKREARKASMEKYFSFLQERV